MKRFNITILLVAVLLVVGGLSLFMLNRLENQPKSKDQVYLVIKTVSENTDFWSNVINGAGVAATELGVEVVVKGPEREIYIDDQIALIKSIIEMKPEAIAIAASEYYALAEVCDEAVEAGITLVTFDSDAAMTKNHSFVATNNLSAAKRIGHELSTLMGGQGKVAILSHVEGAFTAIEREEGFLLGIRPFEEMVAREEIIYTDNSREIAYESAIRIIEENPDIDAIFGTNEVTLLGVGEAVKDLGLSDEIHVVGFDMNDEIALMIEEGAIDATMVQKPFNMGYIAVKEALEVMDGKEPEVVDTGAVLINKENMFLPENQKLIVPNVD